MSTKLLHINSDMKKKQLEGFNIGLEISNIVSTRYPFLQTHLQKV